MKDADCISSRFVQTFELFQGYKQCIDAFESSYDDFNYNAMQKDEQMTSI